MENSSTNILCATFCARVFFFYYFYHLTKSQQHNNTYIIHHTIQRGRWRVQRASRPCGISNDNDLDSSFWLLCSPILIHCNQLDDRLLTMSGTLDGSRHSVLVLVYCRLSFLLLLIRGGLELLMVSLWFGFGFIWYDVMWCDVLLWYDMYCIVWFIHHI